MLITLSLLRELSGYDHSPERTWWHLDTCRLQTHLHARIPRGKYEAHGLVQNGPQFVVKDFKEFIRPCGMV